MKLDTDRLNHLDLDEVTTVALLIADATQNVRSPEARAAGVMLFLSTYLDVLGESPQDVATVVGNMRAAAKFKVKGHIAALAEYVAQEMLKSRTAEDILEGEQF